MSGPPKAQLNQSLIDGIATLQELALSSDPIGCRALARRLNMDPTRVNRLLQTLEHIGIARKTAKRKYAP
ncbi:helix-turn-helix domain-containing protein [Paraglaciecola aquimarina]|uniref:Helix-turn-helix domain-containing protein n=1 Tax=Paraglaciecola aquimarina TaxID=1235557 RepID=A0ABU3SXN1_9ALTE|nr:helix-turn-helix domain-containing protein [Paraglaciecola aquimarina]MDU0354753.1 helix-turn-helix domain-containing protein [Paraglaciecola aquimarina]